MKKFLNIITFFFRKIFTPVNLTKIIVIFFVGFISRYLVNDYFGVNVFREYLTFISITFYSVFAVFIVFVNEFFSFFDISIIPDFCWTYLSKLNINLRHLLKRFFKWIFGTIPVVHMDDGSSCEQDNTNNSKGKSYHKNSFHERMNRNSRNSKHHRADIIYQSSHDFFNNSYYKDYNAANQSNKDSNKYFYISTINENGLEKRYSASNSQISSPCSTAFSFHYDYEQSDQCSNRNSHLSIASSNDTSRAVLGRDRTESYINWPARRHNLFRAMQDEAQFFKQREIPLQHSQTKGEISLGIKFVDTKSNVESLYVKYHDLAKRKFYWSLWEKNHGIYDSYEEYKKKFDPNMSIFKEIAKTVKSDITKEVKNLLNTNPFAAKHSSVINKKDIKINCTPSQARLNEINARKYKSN